MTRKLKIKQKNLECPNISRVSYHTAASPFLQRLPQPASRAGPAFFPRANMSLCQCLRDLFFFNAAAGPGRQMAPSFGDTVFSFSCLFFLILAHSVVIALFWPRGLTGGFPFRMSVGVGKLRCSLKEGEEVLKSISVSF